MHTIFTQKANHAYELLRDENVDLSYYQALGCVGGDGMYSELLNGMLKRNKVSSNSSSPIPANGDANENENSRSNGSRRNSSSLQKSNARKNKHQDYSDSSNDELKNNERSSSGQSNKTNRSYQVSQSKKNELLNQKRRQKLGVRYSLPNDKSNLIDAEELNRLRSGKRYSLPISPFKSKSIDLSNQRNLPLLIVPGGSTGKMFKAIQKMERINLLFSMNFKYRCRFLCNQWNQ